MHRVIQRELVDWQERASRRVRSGVAAQDVLEHAVHALRLAIRLWMRGCRHDQPSAKQIKQSRSEHGREAWISVGDDQDWDTIVAEYDIDEDRR